MKKLNLFIPIIPIAKARPRFGQGGRTYTPKTTADYENKLKKVFAEVWGDDTPPMEGPIMAEVWFYMPRPKSVSKKKKFPDTKPDIDNLEKAVFDALDFRFSDNNRKIAKKNKQIELLNKGKTSNLIPLIPKEKNGRVIDNDSRIVSKISHKRFFDSSGKSEPGVEIFLKEMGEEKLDTTGSIIPIAVIFTGKYSDLHCKRISNMLLQKGYCPVYLDVGEQTGKITKYTTEILKLTDLLCVIENKSGDSEVNPNLQITLDIASRLGKETFKITF